MNKLSRRTTWQLTALFFVLALPIFVLLLRPGKTWIDDSHRAFLPESASKGIGIFQDFPVFWWNFLVFEPVNGEPQDVSQIREVCQLLANQTSELIHTLPCAVNLGAMRETLYEWSQDVVRRRAPPSSVEAKQLINESLAKASLPVGRDLIELLRMDPFGATSELQSLAQAKTKLGFEQRGPLFFDPASGRTLAPVQFAFAPGDTLDTRKIADVLKSVAPQVRPVLLGVHQSTLENESTVRSDVQAVSVIGTVLLLLISAALLFTGRGRILWFFPPLFMTTATAAALTILFFGKIHGLVLAFGPGIVGLTMDYAIHAAFAPKKKNETWLANSLGVLTTLTVIGAGLFSQLPLLRQLMFFSGAGLLIGFVAFYSLHHIVPTLFVAKSFFRKPLGVRVLTPLVPALLIAAVIGVLTTHPAFQMSDLNFETPTTAKLSRWLVQAGKLKVPHLLLHENKENQSPLVDASTQKQWAKANGIQTESIASFLPETNQQLANIKLWQVMLCRKSILFTNQQKSFFEPFLSSFDCEAMRSKNLESLEQTPRYLKDFESGSNWVSLWFPDSPEQVATLKAQYPDISSVSEIAALFPQMLLREVGWMAPTVFLVSFILLLIYYRRFSFAAAAMLPFVSGMGMYFLVSFFVEMKLSFITLIGFIMVFGFSLDYGIFSTDAYGHEEDEHAGEVRSALTLTSLTTIAGFFPLVFAGHPALKHLGQSLLLGSIGTYLGSLWGVPLLMKWATRKDKQNA